MLMSFVAGISYEGTQVFYTYHVDSIQGTASLPIDDAVLPLGIDKHFSARTTEIACAD